MLAGTYMRTVQIRHRTFRAAQTVPQFPLRIAIVAVLTIVASCVSRPAVQPQVMEVLDADTPKTTVEGNAFTAPAGWGFTVRGPATILHSPEGDSHIALVDVHATDADAAVAAAWAAYDANKKWPLKVRDRLAGQGWLVEHPVSSKLSRRTTQWQRSRPSSRQASSAKCSSTPISSPERGALSEVTLLFRDWNLGPRMTKRCAHGSFRLSA